jgi:hypothetical protein
VQAQFGFGVVVSSQIRAVAAAQANPNLPSSNARGIKKYLLAPGIRPSVRCARQELDMTWE